MKKMGVIKLRTIGYNPQANGLTEESMSTVKSSLRLRLNRVYGTEKPTTDIIRLTSFRTVFMKFIT